MNNRFKFRLWDKAIGQMSYDVCVGFIKDGARRDWVCADICDGQINYCDKRLNDIELMQCTGLKDKNGKLIYENDIVKVPCGNFIIKYCDNCKSFQCFYKDDCFACGGDYHWFELLDDLENLEVIGNIYENPNY